MDQEQEIEVIGTIQSVFLDYGAVMIVSCHCVTHPIPDDMYSIQSIDFSEFEALGMKPVEEWIGRRCKLIYERVERGKKLIGAIVGRYMTC